MSAIDRKTASVDALQDITVIGSDKAAAIVQLQQEGPVTMAKLTQATNKPSSWFQADQGIISRASSATDETPARSPATPITLSHAADVTKMLLAQVRQLQEEQRETERRQEEHDRREREKVSQLREEQREAERR